MILTDESVTDKNSQMCYMLFTKTNLSTASF